MDWVFYLTALVAIAATVLVVTESHAIHALLYFVVSLMAVAVCFFLLGATFVAVMEVVVYAGAIMVLFLFAVMMLSWSEEESETARGWLNLRAWIGPTLLVLVLFAELLYVLLAGGLNEPTGAAFNSPVELGLSLFGPYALVVEMASMLLLAALVGAYHIGQRGAPRQLEGAER